MARVSCHFAGRFPVTTVGLLLELILKALRFVFKREGAGCAYVYGFLLLLLFLIKG